MPTEILIRIFYDSWEGKNTLTTRYNFIETFQWEICFESNHLGGFLFPFLYSEDKGRFLKLEDSLTHTNFFVYWHNEISIFRDLVLKSLNNNQILICCLPRSALFCNGDNISFPCYFKSGNRKLFPLPNFFPLLRLCTLLVLFHEAISPSLISLLST